MFKRAEFEVTYKCNLNCLYCYRDFLTKRELDTRSCLNIIQHVKKLGIKEIHFTGGEPLLRKDIFLLLAYSNNIGLITVLETNGTLINKDYAFKIKNLGISRVKISLDGVGKIHEYLRGKGSFNATIRGVKYLVDCEQYTEIQLTLSKLNLNNIFEVLDLCEKLGINSFRVRLLLPGGKGLECKNLLLTPKEVIKIYKELKILKKKYSFCIHTELLKDESIKKDMLTSFSIDPAGYVRPYIFSNLKLNRVLDIQNCKDLELKIRKALPVVREECKAIEKYLHLVTSKIKNCES